MGMFMLRHNVTGEMKGPYDDDYPAEWPCLLLTGEYTLVRYALDKDGCQIFERDWVSINNNQPFEIIARNGTLGAQFKYGFNELDRIIKDFPGMCKKICR
jgi:hypothetical protein